MASGREYLQSLGLEIAKRKYYNAAKVESVIDDFSRRTAALEEENASLRARAEALSCGREEIGEAILSAKTISQQLIAEAREQAEAILAEARAEAERLVAEAKEKAAALKAESETREQLTIRGAQENYLRLREQCLDAVRRLDSEWQRFLCSLGDGELGSPEGGDGSSAAPDGGALPADLADKLGAIARSLDELGGDEE